MGFKKFLVAADNHGSLICKEAERKLIHFARDFKPHYRIHLGDNWDFGPLRRGASQEERAEGIAEDYHEGLRFLDSFQPTHLCLGNHDDRIWMNTEKCADGILRERCQDLANSAEREFKRRRIAWIPYIVGRYLRMPDGGPKLIHGFRSSSVSTAKVHHVDWGSCIHGHTHTVDTYTARHADGGQSFSVGTLADITQMRYADRHHAKMGWRNGFLFGYINTKTGAWHAWNVVKEDGAWISPMGIL